MSVLLEMLSRPFFSFLELFFRNTAEAISQKISFPFYQLMVFLGLGHYSYQPDAKDSWRAKCFWEEAQKRGIKMYEFHQAGIPVARGGTVWTYQQALKIFNRIDKPVITKPNLGSRSRHTLIHINTPEELKIGFKKAKKLSPLVVVEEELRGHLFRGTLVGEKLVGVVRRDQPEVYGDGFHTLRELVAKENRRPERAGPIFHKIVIDKDALTELEHQNVIFDSIPKKGQTITFSQKTSRGMGGTTMEVTRITHPDNIAMLEKVGAYLKDPLVGIDFIMEDISKSWKMPDHEGKKQHCGIIECNSCPFIDLHHYPLFGHRDNVAGALWDLVMPETKTK
jgi:cyanophycin synthetase